MTSAWRAQASTSTNATSSFVSPVSLFQVRLTAKVILVTAVPLGVYRNSGSRVRLPAIITLLKPVIIGLSVLGCRRHRFRRCCIAQQHAENFPVHGETVPQLVEDRRFALKD